MKNKLTISIVALVIAAASFTAFTQVTEHLSKPNQVEGIYVYQNSTPVDAYIFLGDIKGQATWSGQPSAVLKTMINQVQKKYPSATAIIIDADMNKAEAIMFK